MMSHPSPFVSAASHRPQRMPPRFSDTVFMHNEQDDDYSSFAPTQMADAELRPDTGLERRLPSRRHDEASSSGNVRAAEPLESTLPRQTGPRRIESGTLRTSSSGVMSIATRTWAVCALLAVGVIVLLLIAR